MADLARGLLAACVLAAPAPVDDGCLSCHLGIEQMHPWMELSCTDCHGGDGAALSLEEAHVAPAVGWPKDERVMHTGFDPPLSRFRNPTDLRVIDQTCGVCHDRIAHSLPLSLHGTTAGHLNDGLYENGLNPTREAVYGIFAVKDSRRSLPEHALAELLPIESLRPPRRDIGLGSHFADLPRKACMQCHLYSDGFAVRGRLGQDGLYRSNGCAACHVTYAEDGLSMSADRSIDRFEPGHPIKHQLTSAPPTSTCVHCHVGDASIGNGFQGMAQLYPQMAAGPDVPGTTDRLIANQFFIQDDQLTPPDLHHAAGMHCIDCHTDRDVMGDGNIYGAMEHAVEIECVSCHGTIDEPASLRTSRGNRLLHVERKGSLVVFKSKVTGRVLRVKQVRDVVDPAHPDYNPRAAAAMTPVHDRLECYSCHSGWNTNFFGFHFDRNEQFSQLDLITGNVRPGVVSTQERVFATLRQFVLGLNPEGKVAPFMVGFSSMGTVHGPEGELLIDQGLPETADGLSGMTMIMHQPHTTQPVARSCIECHRSPATWGLGSGGEADGSFALARGLVVAVGERGVETLLLDRENPQDSLYLARLPLGGATRVVVDSHIITGRASTAFVVLGGAGVVLVDVRNPAFPSVRAFVAAGDARDVALEGDLLLIANGVGGLRVVDVSDRDQPRLISDVVSREARGLSVQWPLVYLADGAGGLLVVDLSVPSRPAVRGQLHLNHRPDSADDAESVATLFQYGRPKGPRQRTDARMLAVVANGAAGITVVDVTEPEAMVRLTAIGDGYVGSSRAVDVVLNSRFELGDTTGLSATVERDLAYVLTRSETRDGEQRGDLMILDLTKPDELSVAYRKQIPNRRVPTSLTLARSFNPPALVTRLLVANNLGVAVLDVTDTEEPTAVVNLPALGPLSDIAVEAFAFDQLRDGGGRKLKDISHEGASYLPIGEVHRVLSVPGDVLGTLTDGGDRRQGVQDAFGESARPGGRLANSLPGRDDEQIEAERLERLRGGFRIAASEPLARMLRHTHPPDYDANDDGELSRAELERLFFDVLDANEDGVLDMLEWPRHPSQDPPTLDTNRDGEVSRREMDLDQDVMMFLDVDRDGRVQFSEWPWEVFIDPLPSLYYSNPVSLRKLVTRMGFEKARPVLYRILSGSVPDQRVGPRDIPEERLVAYIARARNAPLADVLQEPVIGDFIGRWDLDGDGDVDGAEHEAFARLAERCDLDRNGKIDRRDAPER